MFNIHVSSCIYDTFATNSIVVLVCWQNIWAKVQQREREKEKLVQIKRSKLRRLMTILTFARKFLLEICFSEMKTLKRCKVQKIFRRKQINFKNEFNFKEKKTFVCYLVLISLWCTKTFDSLDFELDVNRGPPAIEQINFKTIMNSSYVLPNEFHNCCNWNYSLIWFFCHHFQSRRLSIDYLNSSICNQTHLSIINLNFKIQSSVRV